jgi:succinyl-CoA synthetase alpha subunit
MRTLEHESKEILKRYGIDVPSSRLVSEAEDLQVDRPVVLFCEPGGIMEDHLGRLVTERGITILIVGFVAGRFVDAMPGIRFGHAATVVEGDRRAAKGKIESTKEAGIHVAEAFSDIVPILSEYP